MGTSFAHLSLRGHIFPFMGASLRPGLCPGGPLACGGSIPPGPFPLLCPQEPAGLPLQALVAMEGGNLWACPINPKRWKFGWLACHTAEWGERKEVGPALGTTSPGFHPLIINNYDMPPPSHPSGVLVAPSRHETNSGPAMATP